MNHLNHIITITPRHEAKTHAEITQPVHVLFPDGSEDRFLDIDQAIGVINNMQDEQYYEAVRCTFENCQRVQN